MRTRAYRRHQRARIKARHLRDYYQLGSWSARWAESLGFGPPKDLAVRHPLDCGKRCKLCHMEKLTDGHLPESGADRRAILDQWEGWGRLVTSW